MSLKNNLEKQIEVADWTALKSHFERQALILIRPPLTLLEVGLAFAEDEKALVENWLKNGQIWKCHDEDIEAFGIHSATQFEFMILQPFVLAQLIRLQAH